MAVAFELVFPGGTAEQYDEVLRKMNYEKGGAGHPEALFHIASIDDQGVRVIDVWKSQEAFDAFAQESIGPITQEVGLAEPQITPIAVYNHLTGG